MYADAIITGEKKQSSPRQLPLLHRCAPPCHFHQAYFWPSSLSVDDLASFSEKNRDHQHELSYCQTFHLQIYLYSQPFLLSAGKKKWYLSPLLKADYLNLFLPKISNSSRASSLVLLNYTFSFL